MSDRREHVALAELLSDIKVRLVDSGLVRTSRAVSDAMRLIHWESVSVLGGEVGPRKLSQYDASLVVLHDDDEISAI